MKVLHISTFHKEQGVGRALGSLIEGLDDLKIDNWVYSNKSDMFTKTFSKFNAQYSKFSKIKKFGSNDSNLDYGFSSFTRLNSLLKRYTPDILHLHFMAYGHIDLEKFLNIPKPKVITMHDMWGFTGGCFYSRNCTGYKRQCSECPIVDKKYFYNVQETFNRKKDAYLNAENLKITAVSSWLKNEAKKSKIFGNIGVNIIGNTLSKSFKPTKKNTDRCREGIRILFGASKSESFDRKGQNLFIEALKLSDLSNISLKVFGHDINMPQDLTDKLKEFSNLGVINNNRLLIEEYRDVDYFICPSRQEAFGLTALESFSQGTPVIALENTGVADIIDNEINGFLIKEDKKELSKTLKKLESITLEQYQELSDSAIKKYENVFSQKVISEQYRDIYLSLVGEK